MSHMNSESYVDEGEEEAEEEQDVKVQEDIGDKILPFKAIIHTRFLFMSTERLSNCSSKIYQHQLRNSWVYLQEIPGNSP